MNCGHGEAGEGKGCLFSKPAGLHVSVRHLKPGLRSKPVGTILFQMQNPFSYDKLEGHGAVVNCTAICFWDDKEQKVQSGQGWRPQAEALGDPSIAGSLDRVV